MIVAQVIIILPIIISVSTETLQQIFEEYKEIFDTFEVGLITFGWSNANNCWYESFLEYNFGEIG